MDPATWLGHAQMARFSLVFESAWSLIKESVLSFIDDNALSKGASIAFYLVLSIAPVLMIIIAIAGIAFGDAAAQGAITADLSGMIGVQTAELLQTVIYNASGRFSGVIASMLGLLTLLVTASGVFGEMQSALNAIWKLPPQRVSVTSFIKARAASLGLVTTLGFLLLLSLMISAGLAAVGGFVVLPRPYGHALLLAMNFVISFTFTSVLFAAIFKILPDTPLDWRDVTVGAVVTAFLFEIGKWLIGFYIGSSAFVSSYGAATGLIVLLLWIYYSAQIFLLGAEFTKAYARQNRGVPEGSASALRGPGGTAIPRAPS